MLESGKEGPQLDLVLISTCFSTQSEAGIELIKKPQSTLLLSFSQVAGM